MHFDSPQIYDTKATVTIHPAESERAPSEIAGKPRSLDVATGSVFELIELQQCEDNYYPLGIFMTLADAVAVVEEKGVGVCNDPEEWAGVEIKERKIGLSDNGKTVWKRSWERNYGDEDVAGDETERWKVITPSQNTKVTGAKSPLQ